MREILFRGKAINRDKGYHRTKYKNGDWVYGLVTRLYDNRFENLPAEMTDINGFAGIEVDYKTVGQYIGLNDKNGKKIFEGDIIKYKNNSPCRIGYIDSQFVMMWKNFYRNLEQVYDDEIEIIGNIYDNPALLEV